MKRHLWQPYLAWGLTAFLALCGSILFFFVVFRISELTAFGRVILGILEPIIIGAALAYLLTPMCNMFQRELFHVFSVKLKEKTAARLAKGLSVLLSLVVLCLFIYALLAMILPQVTVSVVGIVRSLPDVLLRLADGVERFLEENPYYKDALLGEDYETVTVFAQRWIDANLMPSLDSIDSFFGQLKGILGSVYATVMLLVNLVKNLAIGIIVAVYLLLSRATFAGQAKKLIYSMFQLPQANAIVTEFRYAHKVFGGFIVGKILDSIIIGLLCFIGCSFLGMPYTMLVSVIVGVTNVIPFFGPFIGAIPSALIILIADPIKCIYFLLFVLLLQQFDGNILGPKILGDSTGLSSFWVLFAIVLFGGLFGFLGMLLGVPAFAIFYALISGLAKASLRKKGLSDKTTDYVLVESIDPADHTYKTIKDPGSKR